jgi:hypothetical protein
MWNMYSSSLSTGKEVQSSLEIYLDKHKDLEPFSPTIPFISNNSREWSALIIFATD